ncbi:CRISPR-associated DxTHG motif protein [Pseudoflavonifractor sp. BIOML-A6]|nr:CRISPR-associated DxTHG motif protein [Bacteroides thetaiotaomicron]MTQ98658.1 CRISPR-associated DxTHG motif protein [Pseudoflavonifractor sp. BIOML-A16]MTR07970.1 CRISPR-associated DxTHG motif protein [Pseudoflavonifractor sp. BIOML-A15]MTR15348.1 CRISPR-associated DxTHG motif protein [Pseudoflavonifractor sp. BIOML-A17]MTR22742.1 CRISPR-associated DxTHG motif protein [Pseudoflavonifractor sp. BIOML-A19]MTR34146.1 CRISPR-associated DxTHG motif protein [Pseudoflavonifractor sp. BIOML-A14]M
MRPGFRSIHGFRYLPLMS